MRRELDRVCGQLVDVEHDFGPGRPLGWPSLNVTSALTDSRALGYRRHDMVIGHDQPTRSEDDARTQIGLAAYLGLARVPLSATCLGDTAHARRLFSGFVGSGFMPSRVMYSTSRHPK